MENNQNSSETKTSPQGTVINDQQVTAPTNSYSAVDHDSAIKAVHSAGMWALVLGVVYIILTPLLASVLNPNYADKQALVMWAAFIGIIAGAFLIVPGIMLKRASDEKALRSNGLIWFLFAVVVVIMILGLVGGGHGAGLINLLLLLKVGEARGKVSKLKKGL